MTDTDAHQELAALEEAVRDGDITVTATQIARARDAAALADLRTEAALRQAANDEAAQLEAARNRVRAEHIALAASRLECLRAEFTAAVTALRDLTIGIGEYAAARSHAIGLARPLGIGDEAEALPRLDVEEFTKLAIDESRGQPAGGSPVGYPYKVRRHPLLSTESADQWDQHFAARHLAQEARAAEIRAAAAAERAERVS